MVPTFEVRESPLESSSTMGRRHWHWTRWSMWLGSEEHVALLMHHAASFCTSKSSTCNERAAG